MQQDDLIESLENPNNVASSAQNAPIEQSRESNVQMPQVNSNPITPNPLPEDLIAPKKEINVMGIINMISYITLAFAGLFLLILYIIGLLK
jgi:hypothetical protein